LTNITKPQSTPATIKVDKVHINHTNEEYPNYNTYIKMAKEKKWLPIDPMEKLNATVQKFSKVTYYIPHS
jgi:hypothetical protein